MTRILMTGQLSVKLENELNVTKSMDFGKINTINPSVLSLHIGLKIFS